MMHMKKPHISHHAGGWTVEYQVDEWDDAPIVNVYDSFDAAIARAKEIGPLISCGIGGTRQATLHCLVRSILDPIPKLKRGAGRGDTVAIEMPNGRHVFRSKRTARRLGMKTSRRKAKTS